MDRLETADILAVLKAAYPQFYNGLSPKEANKIVDLWAEMFKDEPVMVVAVAVKAMIASRTNTFPPNIGEVKEQITKMRTFFCCRSQSAIISTRQQSESRLHRSRETPERSAAVAPTWAVNAIATAPAWNARAMETVRIKRAIGTSVTCGPSAQPDFAVRTLPYFLRS